MESAGEMEAALQFYEAAQDYLSLVRVYCYCGNLDKVSENLNCWSRSGVIIMPVCRITISALVQPPTA